MKLSAAKAAQEVGKSTATITRAIEKGKISASKDENGAWSIDPAELFRVFAPAKHANPSTQRNAKPDETGENRGLQPDLEVLSEKLRSSEALNALLSDEVADLRRRLDDEAAERRKLTAMITYEKPSPAHVVAAERPKRSWWSWGRAND